MRSQTLVWLGVILLIGCILIGASQCGYDKLRAMSSLENKSAEIEREFPNVDHISTGTLATLINADEKGAVPLLIIDTRAADEFSISKIPGAVNLESAADVSEYLKTTDPKPDTIAVYCSVGYRSAIVVDQLNQAGVSNAKNVRGSIFAWANENRELVTPEGRPADRVHPFNNFWGRLVNDDKRADLKKTNRANP